MQTVYITTPGTTLYKTGQILQAKRDGAVYNTIFPFRTQMVYAFGGVELTRKAIDFLLHNEITTLFLSQNGKFNGQLEPPLGKNVFLRKMQYKRHEDDAFNLRISREIVIGKLLNQVVFLNRIKRFRNCDIQNNDKKIRQLAEQAQTAASLNQLRGFEGLAARLYFSQFNKAFREPQGFQRRVRRPPTDPVNALLSLLYTILFYRVDDALQRRGADSYFGHLHSLSYGRKSLALDLVEELRPIIVDTLVVSLFNLSVVSRHDFEYLKEDSDSSELEVIRQRSTVEADVTKDPFGAFSEVEVSLPSDYSDDTCEEGLLDMDCDGHGLVKPYPVILKKEALVKVIKQFERKLDTEIEYHDQREKMTYRKVIDAQVGLYLKVLQGEVDCYQPLVMR